MGCRVSLLLCCLSVVACDRQSEGSSVPPPETDTPAETQTADRANAPSNDPADTPPEETAEDEATPESLCPHVVLDSVPPLRVRPTPSTEGEPVGELINGSEVAVLETNDGWARIAEPVAGWVHLSNLYDSCSAPAVLAAMVLGEHTYLFLPGDSFDGTPSDNARTPPVEGASNLRMSFSIRDPQPVPQPAAVSLVTSSTSCLRRVIRRVTLVGACDVQGTDAFDEPYAQAAHVLEVRSCDNFPPLGDLDAPIARRVMGVMGDHPDARLAGLVREQRALTPAQRRMLEARRVRLQQREEALAEGYEADSVTVEGMGWAAVDTPFVIGSAGMESTIFRGNARVARWDEDFTPDGRILESGRLLALIGDHGAHGYGFFMVPNHDRPGQLRHSRIHTYSCSAN